MDREISALLGNQEGPYQVGIVVADLERSIAAYAQATGRGPFDYWIYDRDELVRESAFRGEDAPYAARVAIDAGSPQIEYIEPLPGGISIVHEHVERHGYGLHHLGFRVTEVDPVIATMERAGYGVVQSLSGWGLDGDGASAFFDTFDALGFWTEIVAPAARRRPALGTLG